MIQEKIPVIQEDPLGCAVACTAFALSISYKSALRLFKDGEKRVKNYPDFYCKEIVQILRQSDPSYIHRYISKKLRQKIYKPGTIVFLRRSKRYPVGHYLCRDKKGWMDPWINTPLDNRKAGFRKRLPGKPIYVILPLD
jgi:hypothetical protein